MKFDHEEYIDILVEDEGYKRYGFYKKLKEVTGISFYKRNKKLPDAWGFNEETGTFTWIEVVCTHGLKSDKRRFLYWLKDEIDDFLEYSIVFVNHDLNTNVSYEFDPYCFEGYDSYEDE